MGSKDNVMQFTRGNFDKLQAEVKRLHAELTAVQTSMTAQELTTAQEDNKQLRGELVSLINEVASKRKLIDRLKQTINDLQKQADWQVGQIIMKNGQIDELNHSKLQLMVDLDVQTAVNKELHRQLSAKEKDLKTAARLSAANDVAYKVACNRLMIARGQLTRLQARVTPMPQPSNG